MIASLRSTPAMQSTTTAAHERRRGGAAAPAPPGRESEALFGARWRDGAEALRREDPWPAPGPMHEALGDNAVSEVSRRRAHGVDHHFSCVLDRWPVTNQRRTGRCWIFAACNVMRASSMKGFKQFELSQNYLAYFDKVEKANTFLQLVRRTAGDPVNSRVVQHLLATAVEDGGQWNMVADLVAKYGVVPRWSMERCRTEGSTAEMNEILTTVLRQAAHDVREASARHDPVEPVVRDALSRVRAVLATHLGHPPSSVRMAWRDDDMVLHDLGEATPLEFSRKLLPRPIGDYMVLAHDPRPEHPFYQTYVVHGLTSCLEGRSFTFLNLPIDELKAAVRRSLLELREPVWFACDVGKDMDSDRGALVHQLRHPVWKGYGIDPPTLTKAQKMSYGESLPTHAMVFTGLDQDPGGRVRKWRVENSWGDETQEGRPADSSKGFLAMDDRWFDEYVYEVVVPPQVLPAEVLRRAARREPTALPLWDPMGSVAR